MKSAIEVGKGVESVIVDQTVEKASASALEALGLLSPMNDEEIEEQKSRDSVNPKLIQQLLDQIEQDEAEDEEDEEEEEEKAPIKKPTVRKPLHREPPIVLDQLSSVSSSTESAAMAE